MSGKYGHGRGTDDHGKNETIDGAANCHNLHENLRQDTK